MNQSPVAPSRRYFAVVIALAVFFWGMVVLSRTLPNGGAAADEATTEKLAANSQDLTDARREYAQAHDALQHARIRAAAAKKEFEDFVARHFGAHRSAASQQQTIATNQSTTAARKLAVSPQRQELAARLHDLQSRRQELLKQMTTEHPAIQALDVNIRDAERRLQGTPEFLEPEATGPQLAAAIEPGGRPDAGQPAVEQEREVIAGYEAAQERHRQAEQEVRQATAVERRTAKRQSAVRAQEFDHQVLSSSREAVTHWPISALVASLALVAGAAVALAGRKQSSTFTSVADVEASLRIPVVGVISDAGLAAVRQPGASPLLKGLVLMSEVTVALAVFGLTALAVDNVAFLTDLMADPVSGFAHGIERLIAMSAHH